MEVINDGISSLVIQIQGSDPHDTQLVVRANSGGFSGAVATWSWDGDDLQEFGHALQTYPLPANDPPTFVAGYPAWAGQLPFEQIRIEVRQVDAGGHIAVTVSLAPGPDEPFDVKLELRTTYEPLRRFGLQLKRMHAGATLEARLDES